MQWLFLALFCAVMMHHGEGTRAKRTSEVSCLTPSYRADFITAQNIPCCFPFVYKNRLFRSCTDFKWNVLWCSTTSEYSGRWGNCVPLLQPGPRTTQVPNSGSCTFAYTIMSNTHSWNGVQMPTNLTTAEQCREYCNNDGLSCKGFDIDENQSPPRCYSHTERTILQQNPAKPERITQYVKSGTCFFNATNTKNACFNIMRRNTHSLGGMLIIGANSTSSCKEACACKSNCLGFDFRLNDNRCFIHTDSKRFYNRLFREEVDQYEKTSC